MNRIIISSTITLMGLLICSCGKIDDINSSNTNTIKADFTYAASSSNSQIISFTNTSTNANTFLWDFGDSTSSTDMSPTHTYTSGGNYIVKLTATGTNSSHSTSKSIIVNNDYNYQISGNWKGPWSGMGNIGTIYLNNLVLSAGSVTGKVTAIFWINQPILDGVFDITNNKLSFKIYDGANTVYFTATYSIVSQKLENGTWSGMSNSGIWSASKI